MSTFRIKSTNVDAQTFGDSTVYFTGNDAMISQSDKIPIRRRNKDGKRIYKTGLTENDVKSNVLLTPEEKKAWIEKLPAIKEKLINAFGEDSLDEDNEHFWKEKGEIVIDNNTLQLVFDDNNPETLLKKVMVMGGCFDLIAPTKLGATTSGGRVQFYLIDAEEAEEVAFDKRGQKPLAYGLYAELKQKSNKDALLYLCWVLDAETQGYTKKTSPTTLQGRIEDFIEGEFVKRGSKKVAADKFVLYANKWKADKNDVISEAIVNAAEHYGLIYFKQEIGKWVTISDEEELGTSLPQAKQFLLNPKNRDILLRLKEKVDIELDK